MQSHLFIFSNERKYRLARHFIFWLAWLVFFGFLYAASPFLSQLNYFERLPATFVEALLFMSTHIFLSYSLMYFVLPAYLLKNRYIETAVWTIVLFFVTGVISSFMSVYMIERLRILILPRTLLLRNLSLRSSLFNGLLGGLRGGITIAGLAVSIKLMKHWYLKEQRNLQLQKENAESQLQLLKAQIHPHFLFNTLNNIYAYTQKASPVASRLVMGLSEMLRYALYEGNKPLVPLVMEIRMIEEYIELEKIRYGNKLELHVAISPGAGKLIIAPLLLLPFVENCFKHGTSNMLDQPWMNLEILIKDDILIMKLLNGKSPQKASRNSKAGIGIINVRKRLALLYPGRHDLSVTDHEEVFIVNLKIQLKQLLPVPLPLPGQTSKILAHNA